MTRSSTKRTYLALSLSGALCGFLSLSAQRVFYTLELIWYINDPYISSYFGMAAFAIICATWPRRGLAIIYAVITFCICVYIIDHWPLGDYIDHLTAEEMRRFKFWTSVADILFIISSLLLAIAAVPLWKLSRMSRSPAAARAAEHIRQ